MRCAELVKGLLEQAGLTTRLIESSGHPLFLVSIPRPPARQRSSSMDITMCNLRIRLRPGFLRHSSRRSGTGASMPAAWETTRGNSSPTSPRCAPGMKRRAGFRSASNFWLKAKKNAAARISKAFVKANTGLLDCDLVYTSTAPCSMTMRRRSNMACAAWSTWNSGQRAASHDLHSGNWGGLVPNPAWTLTHLLATMFSPEGEILIEGFTMTSSRSPRPAKRP